MGALEAPYDSLVFVECRPEGVSLAEKHTRLTAIDHHEEGDPGYDFGSGGLLESFFAGSSCPLAKHIV